MEENTKKLLEECDSGCQMAMNSMEQIREYVKNEKLYQVIAKSQAAHKQLKKESERLLRELGEPSKEPGMMATAFSWFSTEMKMLIRDDSTQIAKIMMDGCNMGIQSISEKLHKYEKASGESIALAQKLVKEEEKLMKELKEFL